MSLPLTTIKSALYAWLTQATGLPVIWQFQNAPEPSTAFISVNPITNISRIGLDDELIPDDTTGVGHVAAHRTITASITACGDGALAALAAAQDKLEALSLYDPWFYANGLSCRSGDIRNLTGLKNSRYEQRAQMDVKITCVNTDQTADFGYFDHLEYSSDSPITIPTTTIP